jgi:hypothetical protein
MLSHRQNSRTLGGRWWAGRGEARSRERVEFIKNHSVLPSSGYQHSIQKVPASIPTVPANFKIQNNNNPVSVENLMNVGVQPVLKHCAIKSTFATDSAQNSNRIIN